MKKLLPTLPIILFPYAVLFMLYCIFSGALMETFFQNNALLCLFLLLVLWGLALVCAAALLHRFLTVPWSARSAARLSLVVKLAQVPAYILIFLIGLACMITIFTMAFTLVLIVLDCLSILTSGLLGVGAVRRAHAESLLSPTEATFLSIFQFIFCLDIVAAFILFIKSKPTQPHS